jgi:aspartyl/asparaginyl-tRNA synthetase
VPFFISARFSSRQKTMRTLVEDLKHHVGEVVTLYLTLDVLRDQKNLQFLLAHDATGTIQLVVDKSSVAEHPQVGQLLTGSTFAVTGLIVAAAQRFFPKRSPIRLPRRAVSICALTIVWWT